MYRAFSRDVMSAILVYQNNEKTDILVYLNNEKSAILVYQISPVGVELFCDAKTFVCNGYAMDISTSPLPGAYIPVILQLCPLLSLLHPQCADSLA